MELHHCTQSVKLILREPLGFGAITSLGLSQGKGAVYTNGVRNRRSAGLGTGSRLGSGNALARRAAVDMAQRRLSVLIRCEPHNPRRFIGLQLQKEE